MKIREIILEAAYDGMVEAMKRQFPDRADYIDQLTKWAKSSLIKQDRIVWYLRILRATLADQLGPELLGDYQFKSMQQLSMDLLHYYGFKDAAIDKYQFQKQTVSQAFSDLNQLEQKWKDKQEKQNRGVTPQQGDYKIFEFSDGTAWWFVDRAYCPDEGRSGQHCGNVVGKQKTTQRILSLRTSANQVILTFILERNGKLGEMKARGNKKPDPKFHPQIMKLLMWKNIKGISGQGFLPDANFSIFDLDDANLRYLNQNKPILIQNQCAVTPIEILKAPYWCKEKYKKYISDPGILSLLSNSSLENWEVATDDTQGSPNLILYAPHNMPNFKEKLINLFEKTSNAGQLLLTAPSTILKNTELLKDILRVNGEALAAINPTNKDYMELAKIAINQSWVMLNAVPEGMRTNELYNIAINQNGLALRMVPEEAKTPELCKTAIINNGLALIDTPEKFRTPELCKIAVTDVGWILREVPTPMRTPELCKIAVTDNGLSLQYVPEEFRSPELCKIAVNEASIALEFVPKEILFKFPELCQTAVRKRGETLEFVPEELKTLELCKLALRDPQAYRFVPRKFRKSDEIQAIRASRYF